MVWINKDMIHPEDMEKLLAFCEEADSRASSEITIRLRKKNGDYAWCRIALTFAGGRPAGSGDAAAAPGVGEASCSEEGGAYRAGYDTLTGILGPDGFFSSARELIDKSPKKEFAVVLMNVERFKTINDIYGRGQGDMLLRYIARTLASLVKQDGVYGRLSGDSFAVCIPFEQKEELSRLAERILYKMQKYNLGYSVNIALGICVAEDRAVPVSVLCSWANRALQTARGGARRKWAFFDETLRGRRDREQMVERVMESALKDGQFEVYLQPKVMISTRSVIGAEVLVRWNHPQEGLLSPDLFVPLFERNGFIIRLDESIWEQTCRMLRSWMDRGIPPIPVSLNVSRIHAYNAGFAEKLMWTMDRYHIPCQLIELELTERVFTEDDEKLYDMMKLLKQEGFSISMDDFGAGHSSLNMLKNAPIDAIKLDQAFLREGFSTPRGAVILRNMVSMAKQLEMHVVAEGVEQQNQVEFLKRIGCPAAQGYYFSKPLPVDQFERQMFNGSATKA